MKRTKPAFKTITDDEVQYDIDDEPIVISKSIIDTFLKDEEEKKARFADLMALYSFYYYVAKWQKTNQPRASASFCSKALGWNPEKVTKVKSRLIELGLIENIRVVNKDTNKVVGWFNKIKFMWRKSTVSQLLEPPPPKRGGVDRQEPPPPKSQGVEKEGINSYSTINKNSLSTNISPGAAPPGGSDIKKDKIERNKKYIPLAEKLALLIQTYKNISFTQKQINQWANEFRRLEEENKVPFVKQRKVLHQYSKIVGNEFVPVVESGSSFRQKFIRIEEAIKRNESPSFPKSNHQSNRFTSKNNAPRTRVDYYQDEDGNFIPVNNQEQRQGTVQ